MLDILSFLYKIGKDIKEHLEWEEKEKLVSMDWVEKSGLKNEVESNNVFLRWTKPEKIESRLLDGYIIFYEIDKRNRIRHRIILRDGSVLMAKLRETDEPTQNISDIPISKSDNKYLFGHLPSVKPKTDSFYGNAHLALSENITISDSVSGFVIKPNKEIVFEDDIRDIKSELSSALKQLETTNQNEIDSSSDFLNRVGQDTKRAFLDGHPFFETFLKNQKLEAFILTSDIRKSTVLMQNCITEEDFADFINALISELSDIAKNHFGIYGNFTGDGMLAFFPETFAGNDAGYYCLQTSIKCHESFNRIYKKYAPKFKKVLVETGLGIGIDFGKITLSTLVKSINIIGDPVVTAYRLSGAPAGKTYINNQAFQKLNEKYRGRLKTKKTIVNITGVGKCEVHSLEHFDEVKQIEKPEWLKHDSNHF